MKGSRVLLAHVGVLIVNVIGSAVALPPLSAPYPRNGTGTEHGTSTTSSQQAVTTSSLTSLSEDLSQSQSNHIHPTSSIEVPVSYTNQSLVPAIGGTGLTLPSKTKGSTNSTSPPISSSLAHNASIPDPALDHLRTGTFLGITYTGGPFPTKCPEARKWHRGEWPESFRFEDYGDNPCQSKWCLAQFSSRFPDPKDLKDYTRTRSGFYLSTELVTQTATSSNETLPITLASTYSSYMTKVEKGDRAIWGGGGVPPCCDRCFILAGTVDIQFWPPSTSSQPSFVTASRLGHVFTSPYIYIAWNTIKAADLCSDVGEDHSGRYLSFLPEEVSSITPRPKDIGGGPEGYFATRPMDWGSYYSYSSKHCQGRKAPEGGRNGNIHYTDFDECFPRLKLPNGWQTILDPAWNTCITNNIHRGFLDPPMALTPAPMLLPVPTSPVSSTVVSPLDVSATTTIWSPEAENTMPAPQPPLSSLPSQSPPAQPHNLNSEKTASPEPPSFLDNLLSQLPDPQPTRVASAAQEVQHDPESLKADSQSSADNDRFFRVNPDNTQADGNHNGPFSAQNNPPSNPDINPVESSGGVVTNVDQNLEPEQSVPVVSATTNVVEEESIASHATDSEGEVISQAPDVVTGSSGHGAGGSDSEFHTDNEGHNNGGEIDDFRSDSDPTASLTGSEFPENDASTGDSSSAGLGNEILRPFTGGSDDAGTLSVRPQSTSNGVNNIFNITRPTELVVSSSGASGTVVTHSIIIAWIYITYCILAWC